VKINKILSSLILCAILALPVIAMAALEQPETGYTWDVVKAFILGIFWLAASVILVIMFIVSGIMFMISSGNPEKISAARSTLLYAVVGTVVVILAGSILTVVKGWIQ